MEREGGGEGFTKPSTPLLNALDDGDAAPGGPPATTPTFSGDVEIRPGKEPAPPLRPPPTLSLDPDLCVPPSTPFKCDGDDYDDDLHSVRKIEEELIACCQSRHNNRYRYVNIFFYREK